MTTSKNYTVGGDSSENTSEITFIGDDYFVDIGDLQLLDYGGVLYTRDSEGDLWRKPDPRLEQIYDAFDGLHDDVQVAPPPSPRDKNAVRLPDEVIDGHQVMHVQTSIEVSGDEIDLAGSMQQFLDSLPIPGARDLSIPDISRFDTVLDFWLDADTFEYRAFGTSVKTWDNDQLLASSHEKVVISDVNASLKLPGPLPSREASSPSPSPD